ncbi:cyclohexanecarboxylate-CoA ligase [Subtercola boreus]|uniref:Cyclohexanecarboxylate-CoA ligase n=1 Tax=Subtercola boreus TaxID=120213 RepID=A0A3E0VM11_9MICO|nr:AMP-binding protein [Subtercola boreus]RFA10470.1 cyclohexanecarboxylate-CoA ligase [Subtercola boreus]TQL55998.1 cyclohexanecarboxylate-CoA ligase/acyl-CoA synthetase [Subtercola boreus]
MTTTDNTTQKHTRYTAEQVDDFERTGQWDTGSLASHLDELATNGPDRIALTDRNSTLTRGELHDQSRRLALSLKKLGISHGDRVQVQLPNWNEFVVIYLALARLGAVLVPTMPVYRGDEVKFVIDNSGAKMSIVTANFRHFDYQTMIEDIRATTPALENVVIVRGETTGSALSYDDLIAGDHVPTDAELGPLPSSNDTHAVIYTSGTESRPKGCEHTFATMSFTARRLATDVFQLTEDDIMFMPTPVTHATGLAAGVMLPLLYGAAIHLVDVWEPNDGLRRIAEYQTTVSMSATPFLQMALAALKADPTHDVSSMRVWASAGAPIPEALLREWHAFFPGCLALPVYGNSEALIVTAMQHDDPGEKALTSDGRPASGVTLEIRDEAGVALGEGQEGEITFRSPGMLLGYWNDPEKTDAAIGPDGFFHSGDLGRVDGGYLRVTGRIKDLIIRGGLNISAREVEENAAYHPGIQAIAAVSMPDERMGEKVCAFIVPAGEERVSIGELAAYLQNERHIAPPKCPERIIFIDELPTTATGKVKKFELRQLASLPVEA